MRLLLVVYRCRKGRHEFKAPLLLDQSYGLLMYRTRTPRRMAVLETIGDPTFDEVAAIIRDDPTYARLPTDRSRQLIQDIVGAVCDVDENGHAFSVTAEPSCTICGRSNVKYVHDTSPEEFGEFEVPPLTHAKWDAMDPEAKGRLVRALTADYIAQRRW